MAVGQEWSQPAGLVESHGRLALGNQLHIVGHIGSNLVHRSSQDNGETWSNPNVIAPASQNYPMQYGGIFALGDTVYLLTAAGDMGGQERHADFRKSIDNGQTWSQPVRITNNGNQLRRARVQAYGPYVHVAGLGTSTDGFVAYFRSTDGGATWDAGTMVAENLGQYGGGQTLSVDGNTVHIPYTQVRAGVGGGDTYTIRSTDNGETWSAPFLMGETSGESTRQARVQVVSNNNSVFVIWQREADSTGLPIPADRLGFNRSVDGGATWLGPEILPDDTGINREHQHVWLTPGGDVHVSWWDGGNDAGYKYSPDFGETWEPSETALTLNGGSPVIFSVVADANWVHLLTGPQGDFQYTRKELSKVVNVRPNRKVIAKKNGIRIVSGGGRTLFKLHLPQEKLVELKVWNTRGKLIKDWSQQAVAGNSSIPWDNQPPPNGVYIVEAKFGESFHIQKIGINLRGL